MYFDFTFCNRNIYDLKLDSGDQGGDYVHF